MRQVAAVWKKLVLNRSVLAGQLLFQTCDGLLSNDVPPAKCIDGFATASYVYVRNEKKRKTDNEGIPRMSNAVLCRGMIVPMQGEIL